MRKRFIAAEVGGLVFLLGFGTLAIMSRIPPYVHTEPSMWRYWSGTLGDALLLPVLVAGLVGACLTLNPALRPRRTSVVVGVVSAAAGAASQAGWLIDSKPRLNWMVVASHSLSVPGWYHAVFLTVVSGFIGTAVCELTLRVRNYNETTTAKGANERKVLRVLGSVWSAVVSAATLGFVWTVVADSIPSGDTQSSITTIALVMAAVGGATATLLIGVGRAARHLLIPIVVAGVLVVAVGVVATTPAIRRPELTFSVTAAVLAAVAFEAAATERLRVTSRGSARLVVLPLLSAVLPIATELAPAWVWIVAVLLVAGMLIASSLYEYRRRERADSTFRITLAGMASLAILSTTVVSVILAHNGGNAVLAMLVGLFLLTAIKVMVSRAIIACWMPLIGAEVFQQASRPDEPHPKANRIARRVWTIGVAMGVGAFLSLAPLGYSTIKNVRTTGSAPDLWPVLAIFVLILSGAALTAPLVRSMASPTTYSRDDPPTRRSFPTAFICLAVIWLAGWLAVACLLAVHTKWVAIPSTALIIILVLLALDTSETTLINSTWMCMRPFSFVDVTLSLSTGVGGSCMMYWAIMTGDPGLGLAWSFAVLIAVSVTRTLANLITGALIYARGSRLSATIHPVWWNHLQDELVRIVVFWVIIWYPMFVLLHSPPSDQLVNVAVATAPVVILAKELLIYGSKRNLEHVVEQSELRFSGRFARTDQVTTDYRAILVTAWSWLSGHIRRHGLLVRRGRSTALEPQEFVSSLGAHLSFITIIRFSLVSSTLIYLVLLLTEMLSGDPFSLKRLERRLANSKGTEESNP